LTGNASGPSKLVAEKLFVALVQDAEESEESMAKEYQFG
jgi:hypothetical protein